jgi:hypothetical protein
LLPGELKAPPKWWDWAGTAQPLERGTMGSRQRLLTVFGFGDAAYNALLDKQGGVCAICGGPPAGSGLHVDHDHKTGRIRGLLCMHCNLMLGYARDNPDILKKGMAFLRSAARKTQASSKGDTVGDSSGHRLDAALAVCRALSDSTPTRENVNLANQPIDEMTQQEEKQP